MEDFHVIMYENSAFSKHTTDEEFHSRAISLLLCFSCERVSVPGLSIKLKTTEIKSFNINSVYIHIIKKKLYI